MASGYLQALIIPTMHNHGGEPKIACTPKFNYYLSLTARLKCLRIIYILRLLAPWPLPPDLGMITHCDLDIPKLSVCINYSSLVWHLKSDQ